MNQIEILKQQYEELMTKMNEKFEEKLQIINKRYHVIEQQLKQKIKILEGGKNKKSEDLEVIKLKAKIISLEKQITLLENNDNKFHRQEAKLPEIKSNSDIFYSILDCLTKSQGKAEFAKIYYPQIDTLIPCLIEILPISLGLLSEFCLNLYQYKYKPNDRIIQLQVLREKQRPIESHLNEIMLSQGKSKNFEIPFNPQTEFWKKIEADKDVDKRQYEGMNIINLTQNEGVQLQIIKVAKQKLEQTYHKLKREKNVLQNQNFQQQFCSKQTIIERVDCIGLILMLSSNKEDFQFTIDQLTEDFQLENGHLKNFFFSILLQKDFDYLVSNRCVNFIGFLEVQFILLELLNQIIKNQQKWYDVLQFRELFLPIMNKLILENKNKELIEEYNKKIQEFSS